MRSMTKLAMPAQSCCNHSALTYDLPSPSSRAVAPFECLNRAANANIASNECRSALEICNTPCGVAISGDPWGSVGNQRQLAISGDQWGSVGNQRPSEAIGGHQRPSEAICGNRWESRTWGSITSSSNASAKRRASCMTRSPSMTRPSIPKLSHSELPCALEHLSHPGAGHNGLDALHFFREHDDRGDALGRGEACRKGVNA